MITSQRWIYLAACALLTGCRDCKRECLEAKGKHLFALVDSSYYDGANRNRATIAVTLIASDMYIWKGLDGTSLKGLFLIASKGDTITKEANSLEYKLIKKEAILSFYPICNGEEVR